MIISPTVEYDNFSETRISWEGLFVSFENNQPKMDNPWSCSAGVIDSGTDGNCIFLTPGTSSSVWLDTDEGVSFGLKIHPWVAKDSDGVLVETDLLDDENRIIHSETIPLANT